MSKFHKFKRLFQFLVDRWKTTDRIEKLYFKKKWHECISEGQKAIDSGKVDFFYFYYVGLSFQELNSLSESTKYLNLALNIEDNPKLNEVISEYRNFARYQIANNYRRSRDYNKAIDLLHANISQESNYLNFYYLLASIYEDMEDINLAISSVANGLKIDPKNKQLLGLRNHLSYVYSLEQSEKRNGG